MADLEDEVAAALASDLEYKLREMTQEADKFRRHAKRSPHHTHTTATRATGRQLPSRSARICCYGGVPVRRQGWG